MEDVSYLTMKHLTKIFLILTLAIGASEAKSQTAVYQDVTKPVEERIEDALKRMTLEEKVSICHAHGKFYSGGVPRLGIPGLWMSDGPHGVRAEMDWNTWRDAGWSIDRCTAFPALTCLAATWNPSLAEKYGRAIGEEAAYRGKNVLLGPGVNICRTPLCGRNFEYMGEDPLLSSKMCVPYIQGLQSNGVAACVKHYALNNQEVGRWTINVECSERALREIYLPAFHAAVTEGGAWSLMGSYNKIRGTHASHNSYTLQTILKEEWGWDGAVVSDWDATHNAREAALNGLDIEMGTSHRPDKRIGGNQFKWSDCYLGDDLLEAVRSGAVAESVVDEKARRVLRLIFRTAYSGNTRHGNMDYAAHSAIAHEIGSEGVVLLKNSKAKGSPLLPLGDMKGKKILVVGDNAIRRLTEGGGSSELKVDHETSVLEALRTTFGADNITFAQGYLPGRTDYSVEHKVDQSVIDSLRNEAAEAASRADLVIFVGGLNKNKHQDCEDSDRTTYDLSFGQPELIEALAKANPRLVCILISGNAVAMPWADKVPAILFTSYLGSESGTVLCDILTGNVNPSGRLPFSIPMQLSDNGAHSFGESSYPGVDGKETYQEDILVGYRWLDTKHIRPRYAFGYGLSYTTFQYGKMSVSQPAKDKVIVTVPVKNTGKTAGSEVVQLYIGEDHPSVIRPVKELKAFRKIHLQSGEEAVVTFELQPSTQFAFYDEASKSWRTNPGTYTLSIGSSSANIHQKQKVKL